MIQRPIIPNPEGDHLGKWAYNQNNTFVLTRLDCDIPLVFRSYAVRSERISLAVFAN